MVLMVTYIYIKIILTQQATHMGVTKTIINTRDEPHADAERYRRLHVIVGDANMSEFTTYLKVGTTALLLEMIEDGNPVRGLDLDDPVRSIKNISRDLDRKS